MSIFKSFTTRNSLIKTLQFRLKPVYATAEKLQELGMLEKDRERSEAWPMVLNVLRRLDAHFLDEVLSEAEFDWGILADVMGYSDSLAKKHSARDKNNESFKRDALLRKQAEMRKKVVKLLASQQRYKDLMNPTKAIKMAAEGTQNEKEAVAVAKFARFTTALVDYFTLKKALFSSEAKKSTIAYRIVHVNFSIYLENLALLKKYAYAGLDFGYKFTSLKINAYNKYLLQSQIDVYNKIIGQINQVLQKLYAQHKLPQALKGFPLKLKFLQNQVLGGKEKQTEGFTEYCKMQEAVCGLRSVVLEMLTGLCASFQQFAGQEMLARYQDIESAIREASRRIFFQDQDPNSVVAIKAFLDAVLSLRRFIKGILRDGIEANTYDKQKILSVCADFWQQLEATPVLYNQVRYFLTRKPYKKEKIRLFFDCAAFGKGWDVNKEADYLLTLFRKQERYYLGIRRRGAAIDFTKLFAENCTAEHCYEKMVYKSFDFVKGMPAVLFSKMILQKFVDGAAEVVLESQLFSKPMVIIRADFEQKYRVVDGKLQELENDAIKYLKPYLLKTGDEAGYLAAVHQRIDLAKRFIDSYKAFEFFDMSQLRQTEAYTSWTEFLLHVNEFTYGVRWQRIPEQALKQLVEDGDLFLFQLDNKDFTLARESEDEQTQLLRSLFSQQNQSEHVLKLLGGVEVY